MSDKFKYNYNLLSLNDKLECLYDYMDFSRYKFLAFAELFDFGISRNYDINEIKSFFANPKEDK